MVIERNGNIDRFSQNYKGMTDTGKKKLIRVAEDFLDIYNTVHEEKPESEVKNENEKFENE
ncbi:MAG: hypothetical protein LBC53_00895 [Spirochaetaceae bacterium]|nr:hypothetical protein [Spirochaetaceae bacterium]